MKPKIAVVQFPGSNCEQDVMFALELSGAAPELVFHSSRIEGADAVVLPGGFAHGDYLRTGAIARFSEVMIDVAAMAADGRPVIGICNGFQILCEAGLVPGALMQNASLRFVCDMTTVEITDNQTPLTAEFSVGEKLRMPINHYEGNYVSGPQGAGAPRKVVTYTEDVNGSFERIAGVANEAGNVVGLMPHPERACADYLGSTDGLRLLTSLVHWCQKVPA